jgi:N-acyl amino acid synthase FeeM
VRSTVEYKLADCRAEREAAFRLIYERYFDAGLIEPNQRRIRITPFHLLETTHVVLATLRGSMVSTVSLIRDGKLGLQMEAIYGPEVNRLRHQGHRLAEVSCLATRAMELPPSEMFDIFVNVVAFTIQLARYQRVQQLLIAVHPDHEPFYRRLLGFRKIGPEKSYPAVRDNLAVACCHDFAQLDRKRYPLYDLVYDVSYTGLDTQRMSHAERNYFRAIVDDISVFGREAA